MCVAHAGHHACQVGGPLLATLRDKQAKKKRGKWAISAGASNTERWALTYALHVLVAHAQSLQDIPLDGLVLLLLRDLAKRGKIKKEDEQRVREEAPDVCSTNRCHLAAGDAAERWQRRLVAAGDRVGHGVARLTRHVVSPPRILHSLSARKKRWRRNT